MKEQNEETVKTDQGGGNSDKIEDSLKKSKNVGEIMQEINKRHSQDIANAKKQALLYKEKMQKAKIEALQVSEDYQTEILGTPIPTSIGFCQCEIIDKTELSKEILEKQKSVAFKSQGPKKRAV